MGFGAACAKIPVLAIEKPMRTGSAAWAVAMAATAVRAAAAIVVAADAIAHQAPVDESPTAFTVHDGAELEVLDQKDDWLQVSVDARKIGWLHSGKVSVPKA